MMYKLLIILLVAVVTSIGVACASDDSHTKADIIAETVKCEFWRVEYAAFKRDPNGVIVTSPAQIQNAQMIARQNAEGRSIKSLLEERDNACAPFDVYDADAKKGDRPIQTRRWW